MANIGLSYRSPATLQSYEVSMSQHISGGMLVNVDAYNLAKPAADAANVGFVGFALNQVDNSTGANGAAGNVQVFTFGSTVNIAYTGTEPYPGQIVYVGSSTAVTTASGSNSVRVGVCTNQTSGSNVEVFISK